MNELKVGIVGAGRFGEAHAQHYDCMPGVQIAAIHDLDVEKAKGLGDRFGARACASLADLLDDEGIRLVSIVTPEPAHRESFLAVAGAGRAIYVEKPLATNMDDVNAMMEASRDIIAFGGHLLRFETRYRQIKNMIPEYGRVFHMYLRRMRALWEKAVYSRAHPALIMLAHDFNIGSWYADAPFARVVAMEGRYRGEHAPDTISVLVEYENGVTGCYEAGWPFPDRAGYEADDRCSVACESGSFELRTPGVDFYHYRAGGVEFPNPYYDVEVGGVMYGPLRASLDYAVNCVLRGEQSEENTIAQAAETVAIGVAAIQSAKESRYITRSEVT